MQLFIEKERERENICIINNELFTWRLVLIATFRWRQRERYVLCAVIAWLMVVLLSIPG